MQQSILKIFIKTSKDTETIRKGKKKQDKRSQINSWVLSIEEKEG